jgi:hypothetical protein
MSSQHASAALTGALLANKGAAAPSGTVSSFLDEYTSSKAPVSLRSARAELPKKTVKCASAAKAKVTERSSAKDAMPPKQRQRARLSVRLDQARLLRLKLAAAHLQRSSQTIMLEALDAYLTQVTPSICGDCACLSDNG